jgi:hypothetical protein
VAKTRRTSEISQLPQSNTLDSTDLLVVVKNPDSNTAITKRVSANNAFPQIFSATYEISRKTTVHLTANTILSLNTTPVTLITAFGANSLLVPTYLVCDFRPGNTAFSTSGNPALSLYLDSAAALSTPLGIDVVINFFSPTSNSICFDVIGSSVSVSTNSINKPLKLSAASNFDGGNGEAYLTITYKVIQLP